MSALFARGRKFFFFCGRTCHQRLVLSFQLFPYFSHILSWGPAPPPVWSSRNWGWDRPAGNHVESQGKMTAKSVRRPDSPLPPSPAPFSPPPSPFPLQTDAHGGPVPQFTGRRVKSLSLKEVLVNTHKYCGRRKRKSVHLEWVLQDSSWKRSYHLS